MLRVAVVGVAVLIDARLQPQGVGVAHHYLGGRGGGPGRETHALYKPSQEPKGAAWGRNHRRPQCPIGLKTQLAPQLLLQVPPPNMPPLSYTHPNCGSEALCEDSLGLKRRKTQTGPSCAERLGLCREGLEGYRCGARSGGQAGSSLRALVPAGWTSPGVLHWSTPLFSA